MSSNHESYPTYNSQRKHYSAIVSTMRITKILIAPKSRGWTQLNSTQLK